LRIAQRQRAGSELEAAKGSCDCDGFAAASVGIQRVDGTEESLTLIAGGLSKDTTKLIEHFE